MRKRLAKRQLIESAYKAMTDSVFAKKHGLFIIKLINKAINNQIYKYEKDI